MIDTAINQQRRPGRLVRQCYSTPRLPLLEHGTSTFSCFDGLEMEAWNFRSDLSEVNTRATPPYLQHLSIPQPCDSRHGCCCDGSDEVKSATRCRIANQSLISNLNLPGRGRLSTTEHAARIHMSCTRPSLALIGSKTSKRLQDCKHAAQQ